MNAPTMLPAAKLVNRVQLPENEPIKFNPVAPIVSSHHPANPDSYR